MTANISPNDFYTLEDDPSQAHQCISSSPPDLPDASFRNEEGVLHLHGQTALRAAARSRNAQLIRFFLGSYSDPEARKVDEGALIYGASQEGKNRVVELLISAGADTDAAIDDGSTPIYVASQNGHENVVQLLLAAGADKNAPMNDGSTPIFVASQNGHDKVVELLLAAGADKDTPKSDGATPVFIASQKGHDIVVELLLAAGADKDAARNDGATPILAASQNGHNHVVELFLAAGANKNAPKKDCWTTALVIDQLESHSSPLPLSTAAAFLSRQAKLLSRLADTRSALLRFNDEAPFRTILDKFQISSSSRDLLFLAHTNLKYLTIDILKDAVKDNIPPLPTLRLLALFDELQEFSLPPALQPPLPAASVDFPPLRNLLIPPENLKLEPTLFSTGESGKVFHAEYLGMNVAVKKLTTSDATFRRELENWCHFRHPNILQLLGFSQPSNSLPLIVMEPMDQSLFDLLKNHKIDLSWESRLKMAHGIAAGLGYLHEDRQIIHRDIKSVNIMVKSHRTVRYEVKIADFGASRANTSLVSRPAGTNRWLAPELFSNYAPSSVAVDIYALGIIFNELFTRKPPYEELGNNDMAIMKAVSSNQRPKMEPYPSAALIPDWHHLFVGLIQRCWDQDALRRPSASFILQEITQMLVEPIRRSVSSHPTSSPFSYSKVPSPSCIDYCCYECNSLISSTGIFSPPTLGLPSSSSASTPPFVSSSSHSTSSPIPLVGDWTVRSWLSSIGISDDIIRMFEAIDLDDREDIRGLSETDLILLGISSMGIRKKILRFAKRL